MAYPIFYVPAGDVLPILFATYDGGTGASITLTGLAVTDLEVYKDGGVTQRASDAGYTLLDTDGIDFDTITGIHGFSIDTGDNTDAGFYTTGAWFHVVVSAVTVDAQTVNFIAAAFRIMEAETTAGRPLTQTAALSANAITATAINADAITAAKIADGAIDAATFAAGAINAAAIAADAITAAKIADGAIDAATFAAGAINAAAIAADAITDAKVAADVTIASVTGAVGSVTAAVTVGTNNDKTGYGLSAAAVQAIWDALTAALTTVGSIGKLLVDNVNATISSRASQTSVDTIDDFLDTEIAAILEDTGTTLDDMVDDLEGRLTAALATALQAHGLGIGRGVMAAGSTTTALVFSTVNGAAPSAVNDFYNGRHIVFTSGALTLQATSISDYTGATTTATVPALTGAPADAVTFIIV